LHLIITNGEETKRNRYLLELSYFIHTLIKGIKLKDYANNWREP